MPDACRCGHESSLHSHGKSCTAVGERFKFCKCEEFRAKVFKSEKVEDEMPKSKKQKAPRESNLLYFIDAAKAKQFDGGRLLDKKEKTYSAAIAQVLAAVGKDGMPFDKLAAAVGRIAEHKSEATLRRNIRWYFSSKRSEVARFVKSERVEPKAAKTKRPAKPRKPRVAIATVTDGDPLGVAASA